MNGKTVAVIGLGLIGGSIVKALHVNKDDIKILVSDKDESVLKTADAAGLIDGWNVDAGEIVKDADIAVLCVPVREMPDLFDAMAPRMKKGAVITDAGSVKGFLQQHLKSNDAVYIGAHPMAGSEKSGFAASDASLFAGRPYVIIKPEAEDEQALNAVISFVKALRAYPVFMDAHSHDMATAMVSHMPHVLSASLMIAASEDEATASARFLAAGCFRDMTRVSGADARMWTDICLTNGDAILKQLSKVEELLEEAKQKVIDKDEKWLMEFFAKGRKGRENFGMFITNGSGE